MENANRMVAYLRVIDISCNASGIKCDIGGQIDPTVVAKAYEIFLSSHKVLLVHLARIPSRQSGSDQREDVWQAPRGFSTGPESHSIARVAIDQRRC